MINIFLGFSGLQSHTYKLYIIIEYRKQILPQPECAMQMIFPKIQNSCISKRQFVPSAKRQVVSKASNNWSLFVVWMLKHKFYTQKWTHYYYFFKYIWKLLYICKEWIWTFILATYLFYIHNMPTTFQARINSQSNGGLMEVLGWC